MFLRNKSEAERPARRPRPVRRRRGFRVNPLYLAFAPMVLTGAFMMFVQINSYGHAATYQGCTVATTEHVYAPQAKQWQYRVHTSCGTFTVGDDLGRGQVFTFDRFSELERGETYTFETVGKRFELFAMYPNILDATLEK